MLTKQILPGMWSKRIAQSLLVGIENGTTALEYGVVVFYETIYFIAIGLAIMFLGIYLSSLKLISTQNLLDF